MADTLWLIAMLTVGIALLVAATRFGPGRNPARRRASSKHAIANRERFVVETLDLAAGQWRLATMRLDGTEMICLRVAGPSARLQATRPAPASSIAMLARGNRIEVLDHHTTTDEGRSCYRATGDIVLAAPTGSPSDALMASLVERRRLLGG